MPTESEIAAAHEASHAFAARELGLCCIIERVTIDVNGHGNMRYFPRDERPARYAKSFDRSPEVANLELVVVLAGAIGAAIASGRTPLAPPREASPRDVEGVRRYSRCLAASLAAAAAAVE